MSASHAANSSFDSRSSLSITAATRSPASTTTSARWSRPDSAVRSAATVSTNALTYRASGPGMPGA